MESTLQVIHKLIQNQKTRAGPNIIISKNSEPSSAAPKKSSAPGPLGFGTSPSVTTKPHQENIQKLLALLNRKKSNERKHLNVHKNQTENDENNQPA